MSAPRAKATIAAIEPYRAGKSKIQGVAKPVKLSSNENALGCSDAARAAYRDCSATLERYPDPAATALREALAAKYVLEPSRLIFGTGSDEIFSMVCQAYLSPGDAMVQPQYAFAAWAIAGRAAGAEIISAPERDYHVDVDAMLAAITPRTRVMFVANPASPSGTYISFAEIQRLHAGTPKHVVLVLDGAYAEFAAARDDFDHGFALARGASNVIVTRTFSKLYGLAALRLGWAYGASDMIETLNRIRLPFNASAPAQAAGLAALADNDFNERSLALAERGRERLANIAGDVGLAALPAHANFVTLKASSGEQAATIEAGLAARGVIVRGLVNYAMPDCLRVTVGTDAEMDAFEAALRATLA
jgi:histidinol-phosphate aminotransferase